MSHLRRVFHSRNLFAVSTYNEEYISIELTEDEFEIINNAICEILDNSYYGLGFELTLKSLKDKFDDIKAVL